MGGQGWGPGRSVQERGRTVGPRFLSCAPEVIRGRKTRDPVFHARAHVNLLQVTLDRAAGEADDIAIEQPFRKIVLGGETMPGEDVEGSSGQLPPDGIGHLVRVNNDIRLDMNQFVSLFHPPDHVA